MLLSLLAPYSFFGGRLQGEQLGTAGRRPVSQPLPASTQHFWGRAWRDDLTTRAPKIFLGSASSGPEVGRLPAVLVPFSLQSPPQNRYDARMHDSLDRRDAGTTLLLIRSAEPLASLYVGLTPQHSSVVTVYGGGTETPSHREQPRRG